MEQACLEVSTANGTHHADGGAYGLSYWLRSRYAGSVLSRVE